MTELVFDPNRTVSGALTEVRTVLSRARTALELLEHSANGELVVRPGMWDGPTGAYVGRVTVPHPEVPEMAAALRRTVAELARWERLPGKPRPS